MGGIFISYRREDSADISGRIYDRLKDRFGRDKVFKDSYNIPAGEDYHAVIVAALSQVDVVLVVIGPSWLTSSRGGRVTRLQEPDDVLRIEVETALSSADALVIPVLVGGARMPTERELPASIRELASRNARPVRSDPDFDRDTALLSDEIARVVPAAPVPQITHTIHFNFRQSVFTVTYVRTSALKEQRFDLISFVAYSWTALPGGAIPYPKQFEDMWKACQVVDSDVERFATANEAHMTSGRHSLSVRLVSTRFRVQCVMKTRAANAGLLYDFDGDMTITSDQPDTVFEVVGAYERIHAQS